MFRQTQAFSSISVDDLERAKAFYGDTLGLDVTEVSGMGLDVGLGTGGRVFVYPKPDHQPATFTVLNFPVDDIDQAVDDLGARGVSFERYDLEGSPRPDAKGIYRSDDPARGPSIAWFKDPAGNVLSVLQ